MDTATRLHEANELAQLRFHDMLNAGVYSDPDDQRTKAYINAERLVDSILVDAKTELDRLQAGDHFLRPAEVGR